MYKNHLTLQGLRIGDWVQEYSEITGKFSMPMYVDAIFSDGLVYLDFDDNEGDVWEAEIGDIAPIDINEDSLREFGFKIDVDINDFYLNTNGDKIYTHRFQYDPSRWTVQFGEDVRYTPTCVNIHELQHAYYEYVGYPLALNSKGI